MLPMAMHIPNVLIFIFYSIRNYILDFTFSYSIIHRIYYLNKKKFQHWHCVYLIYRESVEYDMVTICKMSKIMLNFC